MASATPPASPSGSPPPWRVLLADDARSLRDLLALVLGLEDDFVVVGQASDGAEAVRLAEVEVPDLVVLDQSMPGVDGMSALPQVRAAAPACQVVMLSGYEAGELRAEALRRGAADVIEKGTAVHEVLDRLRAVCTAGPVTPPSGPPAADLGSPA